MPNIPRQDVCKQNDAKGPEMTLKNNKLLRLFQVEKKPDEITLDALNVNIYTLFNEEPLT